MKLWQMLSKLVSPGNETIDDAFSLYEATRVKRQRSGGESQAGEESGDQGADSEAGREPDEADSDGFVHPRTVAELHEEQEAQEAKEAEDTLDRYRVDDSNDLPHPIDADLATNLKRLKTVLRIPQNKDFVLREFTISLGRPVRAALLFIDGMADKTIIDWAILQPLMLLAQLPEGGDTPQPGIVPPDVFHLALNKLVPVNQVQQTDRLPDLVKGILMGSTGLLIDGSEQALVLETKGWEHRSVSEPKQEQVVRGPQEAFNETLRTNTAMIRRRLKTPALITEFFEVGRLSSTEVAMMYLDGITNRALVSEVRRRVKDIKADFIADSGTLEQFIEDSPHSLYPSVMSTERPDRVAAFLTEGHVALIVNNATYALVVPTTFIGLLQTAEDAYVRWPFGSFLRILRLTSYFVALLFPALYVAATTYHAETIPTDLAMAIAASRESVPFPVVVEVLLMIFSFELITEAATRVPSVIGPTIGIVGALVLGQAAVQAGIISPILIIIIAVTALAAFTVPNYSLSLTIRVMRYVYLLAGSTLGFYGIAVVYFADIARMTVQRSFGVPMLAPIAPMKGSSGDVVLRPSIYTQEKRPAFTYPQERRRQPERIRKWDRQQDK